MCSAGDDDDDDAGSAKSSSIWSAAPGTPRSAAAAMLARAMRSGLSPAQARAKSVLKSIRKKKMPIDELMVDPKEPLKVLFPASDTPVALMYELARLPVPAEEDLYEMQAVVSKTSSPRDMISSPSSSAAKGSVATPGSPLHEEEGEYEPPSNLHNALKREAHGQVVGCKPGLSTDRMGVSHDVVYTPSGQAVVMVRYHYQGGTDGSGGGSGGMGDVGSGPVRGAPKSGAAQGYGSRPDGDLYLGLGTVTRAEAQETYR